jgi:hypothetical protein
MTAIRAMTWEVIAFEAGSRLEFEVAFAFDYRALAANEPFLVGRYRDAELATEIA